MQVFDIAIIGAGVAGTLAAYRISEKHKSTSVILIEFGRPPMKRRRQLEGFLGCFPFGDGKIHENDYDKVSQIVDGRRVKSANKAMMDLFSQVNPMKLIKDVPPGAASQKRLKENGYTVQANNYFQWKPESVHQLSKLITEQLEANSNVTFSFDNEVFRFSKKKNVFTIHSAEGDIYCKQIIFCPGRSGWRWATKIYKEMGLCVSDDVARYGIRAEMSAQYLKDFNKSHCTLYKDGLEIGPFCWNGTVIPEDHADLVISAFRSNEDRWHSDKVSFNVLAEKKFIGNACSQTDRLAKLAYLLSNDRVARERIRIIPKHSNDLSLIKEYDWLDDAVIELEKIIPGITAKGYFHMPAIDPMPAQIKLDKTLQSEIDGLYVAGESAGIKGIAAAAIMGIVAADAICK